MLEKMLEEKKITIKFRKKKKEDNLTSINLV